jgi:hypothetical protein
MRLKPTVASSCNFKLYSNSWIFVPHHCNTPIWLMLKSILPTRPENGPVNLWLCRCPESFWPIPTPYLHDLHLESVQPERHSLAVSSTWVFKTGVRQFLMPDHDFPGLKKKTHKLRIVEVFAVSAILGRSHIAMWSIKPLRNHQGPKGPYTGAAVGGALILTAMLRGTCHQTTPGWPRNWGVDQKKNGSSTETANMDKKW